VIPWLYKRTVEEDIGVEFVWLVHRVVNSGCSEYGEYSAYSENSEYSCDLPNSPIIRQDKPTIAVGFEATHQRRVPIPPDPPNLPNQSLGSLVEPIPITEECFLFEKTRNSHNSD
jgi:hypothetical protein